MTVIEVQDATAAWVSPTEQRESDEPLRCMQRRATAQILAGHTKLDVIRVVTDVIQTSTEPASIFYFERNDDGELTAEGPLHAEPADRRQSRIYTQLRAGCEAACKQGEIRVRRQAAPARLILAVPVMIPGQDAEAFGVVFPGTASSELATTLVQTAANYLVLWHAVSESRAGKAQARDAAALLELLDRVGNAPNLQYASYVLVNELQEHLGCRRVAVGVRPLGKGPCRLKAVSGIARFDKRSQSAGALESAMDEAVLGGDMVVWPVPCEEQRRAALAQKSLCSLEDVSSVLSMPLRDHEGRTVGALIVLGAESVETSSPTATFVRAGERYIATALGMVQRLEGGVLARVGRAAGRLWRPRKRKAVLAAVLVLSATLAVPLPYRVKCDCRLEPVAQRFVAAPFEGTLEKACAKPGDVVSKGDLLAQMDGREVRWNRAGAVADRNQAAKKCDAAMAAHDYADAQIAKLEMERLDIELRLLDHRAEHLDIRSPVDGIVTAGDLERTEGAPLVIGQTLFEIAPLKTMVVEIAVPDDEVSYVQSGQPVAVRLDAYPGRTWRPDLSEIEPRSEIREHENVFIAEVTLDNADGLLRPGMKGRAKIATPRRPLGWILFHKPWEYLVGRLRW